MADKNQPRFGIDIEKEVGREKTSYATNNKPKWVGRKTTLTLPPTLSDDFKNECKARKLSHVGVLRDLAICWLIANKEGLIERDYRAAIVEEIKRMNEFAKARDIEDKKNYGKGGQIAHQRKRYVENKPLPAKDVALHKENPFDEGFWDCDNPKD